MFDNPDAQARCALLKRVKTIAVVGLSPNSTRPSYAVSRAMQGYGFRVIPVHPAAQRVLGEKVYARLADIPEPVDLVDECLALGLKSIWIQEGIVNEPAAERARTGGMTVVMNRCIYRDYRDACV